MSSTLYDAWARLVRYAATGIAEVAAEESRDAGPPDYAGTGFIGGWLYASRYAARDPEGLAELLAELEQVQPRGPAEAEHDEAHIQRLLYARAVGLLRGSTDR